MAIKFHPLNLHATLGESGRIDANHIEAAAPPEVSLSMGRFAARMIDSV
jgi:hypothetical protein